MTDLEKAMTELASARAAIFRCADALDRHNAERIAREERLNWFRATLDRMLGRSR